MDPVKHEQWTGVGNQRILKNLVALAQSGADIQIRIPLIKGVNSDDKNIEETAAFVAALPGAARRVNLLPYHDLAQAKSAKLGKDYDKDGMKAPDQADLDRVIVQFATHGIVATVGG